MRKLQTSRFVKLEESFVSDGGGFGRFDVWLVMELCDRDLGVVMREAGGPLEEGQVLSLIGQTLDGLRAIHGKNIIHRDIKPANLLLLGDVLKVADFGLAKVQEHTQTATSAGTLAYMAPEASQEAYPEARGRARYNNTIDVWAVGVIMLEMMTGETSKQLFGNVSGTALVTQKHVDLSLIHI